MLKILKKGFSIYLISYIRIITLLVLEVDDKLQILMEEFMRKSD